MRPGAKPRAVCSCESKSGRNFDCNAAKIRRIIPAHVAMGYSTESREIADGQLLGIKMLRLGRLIIVGGKLRFGQKTLFRCQRLCYPPWDSVVACVGGSYVREGCYYRIAGGDW